MLGETTYLIGRFDVTEKGEEGGNIHLSLQAHEGAGAPVLKLVLLQPISRRLLRLLVLLLVLLLGVVVVVTVGVAAVGVVVIHLIVILLGLRLLGIGGSYHRFPESLGRHNIHATENKSAGVVHW